MNQPFRSALILVALLVLVVQAASAQPFDSYTAFKDSLTALTQIDDATARDEQLTAFWDTLKAYGQIPYKQGASVAFLYRGSSTAIQFAGDFNGWNPAQGPATRMAPAKVWIREETFPEDARLDYKIVRNGSQWILDPSNPLTQRGGFGDNSELRMPAYVPSPWVERHPETPAGQYSSNQSLASAALGYTVNYRVYTPAGYDTQQLDTLPVIYVTDGHEYAHDLIGSMRIVLDNLIAAGQIVPVMAVFIDPRVGGNNLRADQYIENPQFADFVADELVPEIDRTYRTDARRYARAILGTSLGGLNAAYFGAQRTDAFHLIAIQSPAFHAGNTIYDLYQNAPVRDLRIHMTWGTIHDVGDAGERMATILENKGYSYETVALNEGHSWGSWRALLDDVLVYFWGSGSNVAVEGIPQPGGFFLKQNFPNPFRAATTIPFTLTHTSRVRLTVHDLLGRQTATLVDGVWPAGEQRVRWQTQGLPSGTYFYRLEVDGRDIATRALFLLK